MHGPRRLVSRFLEPDDVDQAVELALRDENIGGQLDLVYFIHQATKHAALPATGRHHAVRGFFFNILDAMTGSNSGRTDFPIDSNRLDVMNRPDEALVSQVTQHQQLGVGAQSHQRDQFPLVDIHRERTLGRNGDFELLAIFVDRINLAGQRGLGSR